MKKPRKSDVARWVAILAKPIPPHYGGAALSKMRQERNSANSALVSWGLGPDGKPKQDKAIQ